VNKFIEGRAVKCESCDQLAVAYHHATVIRFGAAEYPTDAYPVCEYHMRLFVRSA